jgi:ubiquinol-cytochrome c reductase cytochrome b subunit
VAAVTTRAHRVGARVGARVGDIARKAGSKVFPGHGSFLLGELTLIAFMVLVGTGLYLAIFYEASNEIVAYDGSYEPMIGVEVSRSYASVMEVTFDRPGGWVIRQTHHWAAIVFVAMMVLHAMRVFFTGAFRRPRRLNWTIGITLLVVSLGAGYAGLTLPHDLLGGTGARIGHAELLSVPVIGPGLVDLLFAGEFGNPRMLHRLWFLHVVVLPIVIGALLAGHLYLVWKQTHTQFGSSRRDEHNVVGDRAWPLQALKSSGLALLTIGMLVSMGALFQIAPIWLYGPFDGAASTVPAQPDWYLGWIEGALRIVPSTEFIIFGRWEVPNAFMVGVLLPVLTFVVLYSWPFLEARFTGDHDVHHLLDRPRDRPVRTAIGVAGLTALGVLTLAGSHDLAALIVRVPVDRVTTVYRWLLVLAPPLAGWIAYTTCRSLTADERAASASTVPDDEHDDEHDRASRSSVETPS